MKKTLLSVFALVGCLTASAQVTLTLIGSYHIGVFDESASEIMYNPPESQTDSLEFVEIYNASANTVDLAGYFFRDGVEFTFPEGAEVGPFEFVVTAVDTAAFNSSFAITTDYEWTSGATSNGGEELVLVAPSGSVADSVDYDDGGSWPSEADGDGYSIVRCDPFSDGNDGSNWSAASVSAGFSVQTVPATEVFADPGATNCFTVGIDEEIITTAMKLYPNPNDGNFFMDFEQVNEATTVQVFSATGQLVREFNVNAAGQVAVSENLEAGIYHVVVSDSSNRESQRIVVLK